MCRGQRSEEAKVLVCGGPCIDRSGIAEALSWMVQQQLLLLLAHSSHGFGLPLGWKLPPQGSMLSSHLPGKLWGVFIYLASFAEQVTREHVGIANTDTDVPPYCLQTSFQQPFLCSHSFFFALLCCYRFLIGLLNSFRAFSFVFMGGWKLVSPIGVLLTSLLNALCNVSYLLI